MEMKHQRTSCVQFWQTLKEFKKLLHWTAMLLKVTELNSRAEGGGEDMQSRALSHAGNKGEIDTGGRYARGI